MLGLNLEPALIICAVLLLAVLFLLVTPVTISFSFVLREACSARITIGWLFGLLRFTRPGAGRGDRRRRRRRAKPTPVEQADSSGQTPRSASDRFRSLLKSRELIWSILRFLRDATRRVRLVSLRVAGRIGLDNPCDTGRLWGMLCAFTGFLQGTKRVRLLVEPEFSETVFELDGRGEVRVVPLSLLFLTARFVLSPTTLRAAWAASRKQQ